MHSICIDMTSRKCTISYGPLKNWTDSIPSHACELLIRNLPQDIKGEELLDVLKRFGIVYKFRLSTESSTLPWSFAFVRYTIQLDALAAMHLLNRYLLANGERLDACKSFDKLSLYVAHIPKKLSFEAVYRRFKQVFPKLRKVRIAYPDANEDRNFAIIEFGNHQDALEVHNRYQSRTILLWGVVLKIAWAKTRPINLPKPLCTVLVRRISNDRENFNFLKQMEKLATPRIVRRMELSEFQRVVTFRNPNAASTLYRELNSISVPDFSIEWVKNCIPSSMKNSVSDFCAELRLICIANDWQIPIILFGKNYRINNVQYGSILLADGKERFSIFLMEIDILNVYDVQSTMCECVVGYVNKFGGLPDQSLVYRVTNKAAYFVCCLNDLEFDSMQLDRIRNWGAIHEMASAFRHISLLSDEDILSIYRYSFLVTFRDVYMQLTLPNCVGVYPKYRNKPALPCNLNDTEIVLVLRNNANGNKLKPIVGIDEFNENTINFTTKERSTDFVFQYVDAESCDFYHPWQRMNDAPVWIPGHTYGRCIKNFIS